MHAAGISAPLNKAARIRLLAKEHHLSPSDIEALTGYTLSEIRAALGRGELKKKPKSRAL